MTDPGMRHSKNAKRIMQHNRQIRCDLPHSRSCGMWEGGQTHRRLIEPNKEITRRAERSK